MTLSLLLPLIQHVSELSTSLSLCLAPVHQLVKTGSILRQDYFSQLRQQGVLRTGRKDEVKERERTKGECKLEKTVLMNTNTTITKEICKKRGKRI
jgi:hypothetical protein